MNNEIGKLVFTEELEAELREETYRVSQKWVKKAKKNLERDIAKELDRHKQSIVGEILGIEIDNGKTQVKPGSYFVNTRMMEAATMIAEELVETTISEYTVPKETVASVVLELDRAVNRRAQELIRSRAANLAESFVDEIVMQEVAANATLAQSVGVLKPTKKLFPNGTIAPPSSVPLVKTVDPELERLLAEEEEIERSTRAAHEARRI